MEKKQLEPKNSLMRIFTVIYLLSLSILFSCEEKNKSSEDKLNRKEGVQELNIKNQNLSKVINNFIANTHIYPVDSHRDILFYFYIDKEDTLIDLINQAPYECQNLIGIATYKKYQLFFYSRSQLKNRLKDLIDLKESNYSIYCDEIIDTSYVDVIYQESFILKNGSINQMAYPLEGE